VWFLSSFEFTDISISTLRTPQTLPQNDWGQHSLLLPQGKPWTVHFGQDAMGEFYSRHSPIASMVIQLRFSVVSDAPQLTISQHFAANA
jgi:hypothetical protein